MRSLPLYFVSLCVMLLATPPGVSAAPLTLSTAQEDARQALGARMPGARLLWVRGGKVYTAELDDFAPQLVTTANIEETNARWSPDGTQVLTVRTDGVYVMRDDFSNATLVVPGGHTASWTRDGRSITCVDASGYKVVRHDLSSGDTSTLYDAQQSPYNGEKVSQAAELRAGGRFLLVFRLTPTHVTEIVDLQNKTYIANAEMLRGDCSPAWAPNGSAILNTARTGSRPVLRAILDTAQGTISASQHFVGLATSEKFYIHGQRYSNDGRWIVFGGKIFAGDNAAGTREIYAWRVGEPEENAVRLTFNSDEDENPSLFIPTAAPVDGSPPSKDGSVPPTPDQDAGAVNPPPSSADGGASSPPPTPEGDASTAAANDGGSPSSAASSPPLSGGCSAAGQVQMAHFLGALALLMLVALRRQG